MLAESFHNSRAFGHRLMRLITQSRRVNGSVLRTCVTALGLTASLGACQSTQQTLSLETEGADFCQAARAIYYSRHDTPPTIAQIKEHNAVGVALKCGWATKAQIAAKGAK
jgi:hypothetical protein